MKNQLEQIRVSALKALEAAATPAALEELRVKLLGKKGELTAVLKSGNTSSIPPISELSAEIKSLAASACRFIQSFPGLSPGSCPLKHQ